MGNNQSIVVIDGNSLINRAYYAMQRPMITKEGLYTQGVYGFLNMLNKILKDYEPSHIAVAFDLKAPTFRHKEYEQYKAGRKKMPIELAMQLPILKDILNAMNINIFELEGYEADDIIGTIAKKAEIEGIDPLIITGDKDALQLASDKTKVIITKKGITEFEIYDDKKMVEVYGLTPTQFIDYKGLRGDSSDNIPGIPGVGEKTALKLLAEFGSVEELVANSDKISNNKMREKIEENAQLALMSKNLATIITNVPIDLNFKELERKEPDFNKLIDIYVKLEFNSFLKKLKTSVVAEKETTKRETNKIPNTLSNTNKEEYDDSTEQKTSAIAEILPDVCYVETKKEVNELCNKITHNIEVYIKVFSDGNHKEIPTIIGVALLLDNCVYYIKGENNELLEEVVIRLSKERAKICGHDLKSDYYALISSFDIDNIEKNANLKSIAFQDSIFNTGYDTQIAEYVINVAKSNYDLKTLAFEYIKIELQDQKEFISANSQINMFSDSSKAYGQYAKELFAAIIGIRIIQEKKLIDGLDKVANELEFPLIEVLASMETHGFRLDDKALTDIGTGVKTRIEDLTTEIYQLAGEKFNINSTQQLGIILFEKLKLPAGKKTKKGYSTGAEVLEKLKDRHPIVPLILEYRMLTKLNGTYIDGLMPLKASDGKIHAHFNQTVTATGRISCTEPNLQNIPIRQELGRKVRAAFIASSENNVLVGADYSQIELRVLAALSGEQQLIEAFNNEEDIHKLTASRVFNVPFDQVTPLQRSNAKAVNFGVIYGMSGFGLSTELNITRKEAEAYIADYFNKYAKVKEFMDRQILECKSTGYSTTIMNRKRAIHEINASNFMVRSLGERLAMNTPIQGSAADIIKLAMIKVYGELRKQGLRSKLILQVHDELILDVPKEEQVIAEKLLKSCMENAISLPVKLTAELESGENWYMLK